MQLNDAAARARDKYESCLAASLQSLHVFTTSLSETTAEAKSISLEVRAELNSKLVSNPNLATLSHKVDEVIRLVQDYHTSLTPPHSTIPVVFEDATMTLYNTVEHVR
jgi:hypothetical protein